MLPYTSPGIRPPDRLAHDAVAGAGRRRRRRWCTLVVGQARRLEPSCEGRQKARWQQQAHSLDSRTPGGTHRPCRASRSCGSCSPLPVRTGRRRARSRAARSPRRRRRRRSTRGRPRQASRGARPNSGGREARPSPRRRPRAPPEQGPQGLPCEAARRPQGPAGGAPLRSRPGLLQRPGRRGTGRSQPSRWRGRGLRGHGKQVHRGMRRA